MNPFTSRRIGSRSLLFIYALLVVIPIAVVAFGPGIHVLLKQPRRPVNKTIREKIVSLSQYGVDFYACGNTLTSLKLGEKDVLPFAKVVEVGASTLMELQKQGYAYLSW